VTATIDSTIHDENDLSHEVPDIDTGSIEEALTLLTTSDGLVARSWMILFVVFFAVLCTFWMTVGAQNGLIFTFYTFLPMLPVYLLSQ
jgi:hypothetical protein